MRVGHFIRHFPLLPETFIRAYLRHAYRTEPFVLCEVLHNATRNLPCVYLIKNQALKALPTDDAHTFLNRLNYPNCYERLINKRKIRLLHAHFGMVGCHAMNLAHRKCLPLVTSFYGIDASHMLRRLKWRRAFARLFQMGDRFIALGNDMARRLRAVGCPDDRLRIVHLGVDIDAIPFHLRQWPGSKEPLRLLYCGRLVRKKGVLDAIEAFARLADRWRSLEFRIVGEGPLHNVLKATIYKLGLQNRVTWLGALSHDEVLDEMHRAHLFVLPSQTAPNGDMEGTPTVLLEAQASGLPVVSTLHADIPEAVIDGISGFLVAEGDIDDLVEKLDLLLTHPDVWLDFGKSGRKHIQVNYNICREVRKLEAVYQELITD